MKLTTLKMISKVQKIIKTSYETSHSGTEFVGETKQQNIDLY